MVEVVSAESQDRDRRYKPVLYAEAGIRNLWRVEDEHGLSPSTPTNSTPPLARTCPPACTGSGCGRGCRSRWSRTSPGWCAERTARPRTVVRIRT
ncbi:hypothetical protein [Actinacidiphila yeochonensis]|uniref:hypothetical protein n=1 Tax=Actinacidiphila yeochonensis TaxID=89050 RepID=UPI00068CF7B0|nr:hypothetical protein [Actinacidiphila yeochonensis]